MNAAVEEVRMSEKWVGGANGRSPALSPGVGMAPPAAAGPHPPIARPAKYDLKGIRDRMKQR